MKYQILILWLIANALSQYVIYSPDPRTITFDEFAAGIPIDYRYNETVTDSTIGLVSAPGCPKSEWGYPWVYFGSPPKCVLVGKEDHCQNLHSQKVFVNRHNLSEGFCNCECFHGDVRNSTELQFCTHGSGNPFAPGGAFGVFNETSNTCYEQYEQTYCSKTEWLVRVKGTDTVRCEQRSCPENQYPEVNPFTNVTSCMDKYMFFGIGPVITKGLCEGGGRNYSEFFGCVGLTDYKNFIF